VPGKGVIVSASAVTDQDIWAVHGVVPQQATLGSILVRGLGLWVGGAVRNSRHSVWATGATLQSDGTIANGLIALWGPVPP